MADCTSCSGATSEIMVVGEDGRVIRRFGQRGNKPGQFDFYRDQDPANALGGVSLGPDGSVYVVEAGTSAFSG